MMLTEYFRCSIFIHGYVKLTKERHSIGFSVLCSTLQCCAVVQCAAIVSCRAENYSAVQCCAVCCYSVLYSAVQCCTVLWSSLLGCAGLFCVFSLHFGF